MAEVRPPRQCTAAASHPVRYVEGLQAQSNIQTLAGLDQFERWVARAERRYLRAIKTLARVRRLLRPSVQVNIAEQQVNMGG